MWSWFSCYQFYLNSALGRPSTAFPVQILVEIIKNLLYLSIFPIYVIIIFNLDRWFSRLTSEICVSFFDFIRRILDLWSK